MTAEDKRSKLVNDLINEWTTKVVPILDGAYHDLISTAPHSEISGQREYRYQVADPTDQFQNDLIEVYNSSILSKGEEKAWLITSRVDYGVLAKYISETPELKEMKTFLQRCFRFWREHSESTHANVLRTSFLVVAKNAFI